MNVESASSVASRLLFLGSFVLLTAALSEWAANLFGYTLLRRFSYTPGRLLELAALFMIFVVALLLRQVREELKRARS